MLGLKLFKRKVFDLQSGKLSLRELESADQSQNFEHNFKQEKIDWGQEAINWWKLPRPVKKIKLFLFDYQRARKEKDRNI